MCLAYPGKIIRIEKQLATVDFSGLKKTVNISLVEAKKGDFVMVHAGFAISVIDDNEARRTRKYFQNGKTDKGNKEKSKKNRM